MKTYRKSLLTALIAASSMLTAMGENFAIKTNIRFVTGSGYDRVIINNGSGGTGNQTVDMVLTHGLIYSWSNQNDHKIN